MRCAGICVDLGRAHAHNEPALGNRRREEEGRAADAKVPNSCPAATGEFSHAQRSCSSEEVLGEVGVFVGEISVRHRLMVMMMN